MKIRKKNKELIQGFLANIELYLPNFEKEMLNISYLEKQNWNISLENISDDCHLINYELAVKNLDFKKTHGNFQETMKMMQRLVIAERRNEERDNHVSWQNRIMANHRIN